MLPDTPLTGSEKRIRMVVPQATEVAFAPGERLAILGRAVSLVGFGLGVGVGFCVAGVDGFADGIADARGAALPAAELAANSARLSISGAPDMSARAAGTRIPIASPTIAILITLALSSKMSPAPLDRTRIGAPGHRASRRV